MLTIGITGISGFVGTHLFNTLSLDKDDYKVIPIKEEDFQDKNTLAHFASRCDVIVHLAAVNKHNNPEIIKITNISLVEELISACRTSCSKAHIIFSSSIQENKGNPYGYSKRIGREKLSAWAKENQSGFTGLIIPNIYGPFGRPFYNSVISTFSYELVNGEKPKIEIDTELQLIFIGELVNIIKDIIDSDLNRITEYLPVQHTSSATVTEVLNILDNFKLLYFDRRIIPSLENTFLINLFNTFRSYIDPEKFFPVKYKNNVDERGNFVEIARVNVKGQVSFSTTKPGITRGNHFHTRKIERFAVVKGEALIQFRKIGSDKVIKFILSSKEPSFVDIPIWYTHNIANIGEEDLYTIFWVNELYDSSDPDTYFETV